MGRTRTTRTRLELAMRCGWNGPLEAEWSLGEGDDAPDVDARGGEKSARGWGGAQIENERGRDDACGGGWRRERERDLGNVQTCPRRRSARGRRAEDGCCYGFGAGEETASPFPPLFPTPFLSFLPSCLPSFPFLFGLAYALRTDDSPHGPHAPPLPLSPCTAPTLRRRRSSRRRWRGGKFSIRWVFFFAGFYCFSLGGVGAGRRGEFILQEILEIYRPWPKSSIEQPKE
jgi:hypothetical protein